MLGQCALPVTANLTPSKEGQAARAGNVLAARKPLPTVSQQSPRAVTLICVFFARVRPAVPVILTVAVLGLLVGWARVGAGIHHPIDVIGSVVFVGVGAVIAASVTPSVVDRISPHLPRVLSGQEPISTWQRSFKST
jgi:hypothetical protein